MFLKQDVYTSNGPLSKGAEVKSKDPIYQELHKAGMLVPTKDEIDPKVETLIEKCKRLEDENAQLIAKGSDKGLQDENKALKTQVAELESDLEKANSEKQDLQTKLDESIADNEKLVEEIEGLKNPK